MPKQQWRTQKMANKKYREHIRSKVHKMLYKNLDSITLGHYDHMIAQVALLCSEMYEEGLTDGAGGAVDRHKEGYVKGRKVGENAGIRLGNAQGYDKGYTHGEKDGYAKGQTDIAISHTAGYDKGRREGYLSGLGQETLKDPGDVVRSNIRAAGFADGLVMGLKRGAEAAAQPRHDAFEEGWERCLEVLVETYKGAHQEIFTDGWARAKDQELVRWARQRSEKPGDVTYVEHGLLKSPTWLNLNPFVAPSPSGKTPDSYKVYWEGYNNGRRDEMRFSGRLPTAEYRRHYANWSC